MILERNIFVQYRSINGTKYLAQGNNAFELDEVGDIFWNSIDGKTSLQEIAEKIAKLYDVDPNTVLADITRFSRELMDQNLVEEATG